MTREEFDRFVQRVETGIGRNPVALRRRVALLALLGYVLLLSGLLLVLVLASGFFAVMYWADWQGKLAAGITGCFILFGGGFIVLRTLLIKVPVPQGVPIRRSDAPALFALLDDLQARLVTARFHQVRLIPVHNAAVAHVPRLGVLGWSCNYLLLGLPLLEGHSVDEVRAILAHEYAHLSRRHGRFSHWIYRLRRSWESMFVQLNQPRVRGQLSLQPLLNRLVRFFWPRFNAHAFVLSRVHEYEADRIAAQLTSPEQIGSALTRRALQDRLLDEKFWPQLWQTANQLPEPPSDVFSQLASALSQQPPPDDCTRWLSESLAVPTTNADTHPCLADRLGALEELSGGVGRPNPVKLVTAPQHSAAETLLQPSLDQLRSQAQALWFENIQEAWRARHARASALSQRLSALTQVVPETSSDLEALWDKAALLLDLKSDQEGETILRQILVARPNHVRANFHLGRLLLDRQRDEGEGYLERALQEDDELIPQACACFIEFYRRSGRLDRLRQTELRLDQYEKDLASSRAERSDVTARDRLIEHELSASELDQLRTILAAQSELAWAKLGRKELRHFPKQKLFLLCVRSRRAWHQLGGAQADQALVERFARTVRLPGRILVFAPSGGFRALARKLGNVPGCRVFDRASGKSPASA